MADVEVLQAYDVHHFNTLPNLLDASHAFNSKDGGDFVDKVFKPLLIKHHLQGKLGIGLLHRHFDLAGSERLVEFNNVSTPWPIEGEGYDVKGAISPSAWLIKAGKLMPYEFNFDPIGGEEALDLNSYDSFVLEFINVAQNAGLDQVVALRLFPHKGFAGSLEFTQGKANITLLPDQVSNSNRLNYYSSSVY